MRSSVSRTLRAIESLSWRWFAIDDEHSLAAQQLFELRAQRHVCTIAENHVKGSRELVDNTPGIAANHGTVRSAVFQRTKPDLGRAPGILFHDDEHAIAREHRIGGDRRIIS